MRGWVAVAASGVAVMALVAALAFETTAGRAAAPTIASATIAPSTATVGDRLMLTISVDHDTGVTVDGPGFGADVAGLEVVAVAVPRTEARGDARRTVLAYTLTSFRTGDVTIPPQPIAYRGTEGDGTVSTDALMVSIRSVLAPGETDLAPLKPQLDLNEGAPPPFVPALFVGAFAALTAFGYALHRRASAIKPSVTVVVAAPRRRPPHERAIADLDAIAAAGLADGDDPGEYYARIAAVVRAYLSERYTVPAYAMTRTEIERAMTGAGIERWPARLSANLLEQCDAAEFAGFRPAADRRAADLGSAYEIIAITRRA